VLEVASKRLPKKFKEKGKQKATTIVQDLGSDSKVTTMGIKGIFFLLVSSSHTSSSKDNVILDGRKINELFHLQVISKHNKIDTLVDSGSQVNLISDQVVKNLGLETRPHLRPYPLGWICDNA
jgi:hypothetical protein